MDALDDDMTNMLIGGLIMFVVGLLICLRRTRFGRQIAQPMMWIWRSGDSDSPSGYVEPILPTKVDGVKLAGIGLMGVGYVISGFILLFVVPGWGVFVFILGFVVAAVMALWRAR